MIGQATSQTANLYTTVISSMRDMGAIKQMGIIVTAGTGVMYGVLTILNDARSGSFGAMSTAFFGLAAMSAGGLFVHMANGNLAKTVQPTDVAPPSRPTKLPKQGSPTSSLLSGGSQMDFSASIVRAGLTTEELQKQKIHLEDELESLSNQAVELKAKLSQLESTYKQYIAVDVENKKVLQVINITEINLQTVTRQLTEAYDRQAEALQKEQNKISEKRAQISKSTQVKRDSSPEIFASERHSPPPSPVKEGSPATLERSGRGSDPTAKKSLFTSGSEPEKSEQGESATFG